MHSQETRYNNRKIIYTYKILYFSLNFQIFNMIYMSSPEQNTQQKTCSAFQKFSEKILSVYIYIMYIYIMYIYIYIIYIYIYQQLNCCTDTF